MANTNERIQDFIDSLNTVDVAWIWNAYCDNVCDYENIIYSMDEFNEIMSGKSPIDIVESLDSNFSTMDDYFRDGVYGLESFSDIYDVVDDDELIDYIIDNDDDFGYDDLRVILDEEDDDEE